MTADTEGTTAIVGAVLQSFELLIEALGVETVEMRAAEQLLRIVDIALRVLGPSIVQQRIDQYATGRAASDVAFTRKFGEKP